ncbi:MAG TPA: response regulator [Candidatus Paceibacterota bacterium]
MKNALVVEDEAPIAFILGRFLSKAGLSAQFAPDFQTGEMLLRSQPFDIVVTDFAFPGGTGLDIARLAREIQPNAKLVIMSGGLSEHKKQNAEAWKNCNFDGELQKPFEWMRFLDLLIDIKIVP